MNHSSLRAASRSIRREATGVLEYTDMEEGLHRFGQPHLLGSYAYDVMLARDIDFHVLVNELAPSLADEFFQYALSSAKYEYISFHDKHAFNTQAAARYAAKIALDSYYFGLRLNHAGNGWQIRVNFITKPQEASVEIEQLFIAATEAQREQMIRFKHYLCDRGAKVSSAYVYRAVLEQGITDEHELKQYLATIGYET